MGLIEVACHLKYHLEATSKGKVRLNLISLERIQESIVRGVMMLNGHAVRLFTSQLREIFHTIAKLNIKYRMICP